MQCIVIPPWVTELLTQVVVPLLAVWLAAHLALKGFIHQQRYERKLQAYTEIIDACATAIEYTEHKSELAKGYDENLPLRWTPKVGPA